MIRLLLPFSALLLTSACATVARGPNADMVVDTEPPGATVTTDLPAKGKLAAGRGCAPTPCTFEVPRRAKFLMTVEREGYEPYEVGVISTRHKESLDANLRGAGGMGAGMGMAIGATGAAYGFGGTTVIAAGAVAAASVAAGVGLISLGVDGATGALLNPNPNPVFIELAPEGVEVAEDPTVERLRIFRMKGPEGRAARKAYKRALKAERRRLREEAKAAERAADGS